MKKSFVLFGFCLATLSLTPEALAFRKFLDQFSEHYDANQISTELLSSEQSCGLCHVRAGGGGKRTPYGEDFREISLGEGKGFPGIEFLDSDKDGFLNLEEIFLQTAPGQQDSAPEGRIELSLTETGSVLVRPAKACAQLTLKAFGFTFADNSNELQLTNVVAEASPQVNGKNGAILAKCEAEQLSGSLQK